jgi:hypothetical protein
MQLIPAGSNTFTKSEEAFCYFEVYTSNATEPETVALRVLDGKTGGQEWDGGAARLDPPTGGKSTIPVGLRVPIAALPSGSYQLEATATNGKGKTATRTVIFEIK